MRRAEGVLDDSDTCKWFSQGGWQSGGLEDGKAVAKGWGQGRKAVLRS